MEGQDRRRRRRRIIDDNFGVERKLKLKEGGRKMEINEE